MLRQIVGWSIGVMCLVNLFGSVVFNDGQKVGSGTAASRIIGLYAAFVQGMAWWYLI